MPHPHFTRQIIGQLRNAEGSSPMNTLLATGDVNSDGWIDIAVCGRNGQMAWFENPGHHWQGAPWPMHIVNQVQRQECGGRTWDLLKRGAVDIINGGEAASDEIAWWENPGRSNALWRRRIIAKTGFNQIHDTLIGCITPDGAPSLVFTNQLGKGGGRLWRLPLPADPRVEPWPGLELIAGSLSESNPLQPAWAGATGRQPDEGLAIGDIDGDGQNEIVCGCHWYKYDSSAPQQWRKHRFANSYITTKIAIADIDGDGRNEILLSEGDPVIYGRPEGGRFAFFRRPADPTGIWDESLVADGLLDAHTLCVGDICGEGHPDILLGEIGVGSADPHRYAGPRLPRLWVYQNNGRGDLTPHLIDEGTGTHDSQLIDLRGVGVLDIVGKPLHGPDKWNLVVWYNQRVPLT